MKKPLFSGVCTALVTPFLGQEVNYPLMEQLLRRQLDAGIKAIVLCGTTGEASTLTDEEKLAIFRRAKEYVGKDCLIIAGTGSNNTSHARILSLEAEACGVDGLLLVSPYYNKANPDGLVRHYTAIAESVHLPVILYNVPSRTGLDMPVAVYAQLSNVPNIAGVKEASADITKITKIRHACGAALPVWSGNDDQITPVISLGGCGVISVLSNVAPVDTLIMVEAALDGDFDTAAAIQGQLQPLVDALFSDVNPIPVKAAMRLLGYDCGTCRLPLGELSEEKLRNLKHILLR